MKLSYRGVNYEAAQSTLEVTEGEIGGLYRGQNWRFNYVRHIPEPAPVKDLKYRGIAYRTGKPTDTSVGTQPIGTLGRCTIAARNKREVLDEITRCHLKNIQRSLEHRLEVAKAKGDENLIQLLEAESAQMTTPIH